MSELNLYKEIMEEYQEIKKGYENKDDNNISECKHENTNQEKGITICVNCGEELSHEISTEKEWRYYGQSDNRYGSDPTRVQMRKSTERTIYKDVENLGLSETVIAKADELYSQITKQKIFRANSRKSIVFACTYHAYRLCEEFQELNKLIEIFGITRSIALNGIKYVNKHAPKDSKIRTVYITPVDLIKNIMTQFSASPKQKQEVIDLYNKIKNKSSQLNRSRPQSIASSVIYYWIRLNNKDISLKEFTQKVSLSELTINKIAKEIALILRTPNVL